jgi:hypothetical protein
VDLRGAGRPPRAPAPPAALDLGCGAGGASKGYHDAGFDVTGWDIEPHPDYPFTFILGDMLDALADVAYLRSFDLIAASPPCKTETDLAVLSDREHPDLLTPTLAALRPLDVPWIVENVASTRKMRQPRDAVRGVVRPRRHLPRRRLPAPRAAPPVRVEPAADVPRLRLPEAAARRRVRHRRRRADDPRLQGAPRGGP